MLRDAGRGAIEIALTRRAGRMSEDEQGLLEFLLDESQRPVTWLAMASRPDKPEASADTLRRLEPLIKRGGVPQVLCKPFVVQMDLRNPFSFADMELWGPVFNQPLEKQKAFYRDPGFSRRLSRGAQAAASVPGQMESGRGARDAESRAQTV